MSTTGRKRKQQLKPRKEHKSPLKSPSPEVLQLRIKSEPGDCVVGSLMESEPLVDLYDYEPKEKKPNVKELQQFMAMQNALEESNDEMDAQNSDSDEDGYSELDFEAGDLFCADEDDIYDPEWTAQQQAPRMIFKFTKQAQHIGLKSQPKHKSALFYFHQVLGNRCEFFGNLARGCNEQQKPQMPATTAELETFMGLCLLMSDVKLCTLAAHWSDGLYHGFSGFADKMSLERFRQLLSLLNFGRLAGRPASTGNAGAASKLVDYFNARMAEMYECGQQLVLNYPITLWKGRFGWRNELPDKLSGRALTLHLLTEQSGLIIKVHTEVEREEQRNSRQLVVQRNEVALELLKGNLGKGRTAYVSKYYGSYALAHELAKKDTYCSGLLDRNRYGNCKTLVNQACYANGIVTSYAGPFMMAKWQRRAKHVYFFSSDCLAIYAKEMSMQKAQGRPKLIQELQWQLKPMPNGRQQLLSHQPACSEIPWDKQLAIYLLNMLVHNAYILYSGQHKPPDPAKLKSYEEFRSIVVSSLLGEAGAEAEANGDGKGDSPKAASGLRTNAKAFQQPVGKVNHELVLILQEGKPVRKNCRLCSQGGMLHFTKYMCKLCPDTPGLCESPCFQIWHELQQKQANKARNLNKLK